MPLDPVARLGEIRSILHNSLTTTDDLARVLRVHTALALVEQLESQLADREMEQVGVDRHDAEMDRIAWETSQ